MQKKDQVPGTACSICPSHHPQQRDQHTRALILHHMPWSAETTLPENMAPGFATAESSLPHAWSSPVPKPCQQPRNIQQETCLQHWQTPPLTLIWQKTPFLPSPTHIKFHPFMSPELSSGEPSPADPSCPSIAQGSMGWQGLNQWQAPGWCPNSLDKLGPEPEPVSWLLF